MELLGESEDVAVFLRPEEQPRLSDDQFIVAVELAAAELLIAHLDCLDGR